MERGVWQIWAGPGTGAFATTYLLYGVALVGPPGPGRWSTERRDEDYRDDEGTGGASVRRFAAEVRIGDAVMLRTGLDKLRAIGVVAGEYEYLEQFDDVNGWDIPHARRVRWFELPKEYSFDASVFGGRHRFSRVLGKDGVGYTQRFLQSPPTAWQESPLPSLPQEEPPLHDFPESIRSLVGLAQDLHGLYWSAEHFGERPREDELIAHFIVPLLRSLGWPPELIAVKWRDIDVSVFSRLPRTPENCVLVIEAKRPGAWPEDALGQACEYVKKLGLPRNIVLTDGIRYHFCDCEHGFRRVAYANLARLKQSSTQLFDRIKRG